MNGPIVLSVGELGTNAYIVYNGSDAIVVDAGGSYDKIRCFLDKNSLVCKYVLLTHGHWDHIGAVAELQRDGAKVVMHRNDKDFPSDADLSVASYFGAAVEPFTSDIIVDGGEVLDLCGMKFKVLHTPGHTAGSVCYIYGSWIFSGDTLFYLSAGRTDFPTGDERALANSLRNVLFNLNGEYAVYPGHDRATSLLFEKTHNPYV